MTRLHPDRLGTLPAAVAQPRYERTVLRPGIVHLGVGAFQRAHLAVATEAALHSNADPRWGIVGVSLRSAATADALRPQQGLYTLALRDSDQQGTARERLQVIGAMPHLLVAPAGPDAVLERIAHADTRIVSLTVTEKGYHHDPASRRLRLADPDIEHDLNRPDEPRTTIGFIVHGLQRRRARGLPGLTLLSCDNLPANGDTLGALVHEFAARCEPALAEWIERHCTFPNSMVDRIVPRTTDADRSRISAALGLEDAWPVVAEPFFDWVIEDRFSTGRPAWEAAGARFVTQVEPFERAKLRLVNGCHSAIAYLGVLADWPTVDRAIGDADLRRFIEQLMRDEIAPTLPSTPGLDLPAYSARLLERFANPALQHRTQQIAMDGSQKIPQRWLNTVRDRLNAGMPIERLAFAVAAWIHYLRGAAETGQVYLVEDPLAEELAGLVRRADAAASALERAACVSAFTPVFGELGREPRFIAALARQAQVLRDGGVRAALRAVARNAA